MDFDCSFFQYLPVNIDIDTTSSTLKIVLKLLDFAIECVKESVCQKPFSFFQLYITSMYIFGALVQPWDYEISSSVMATIQAL